MSEKKSFYFILSDATSGCYYTCFTYNLPSREFFMREDKQKILQHVSHGKFLKTVLNIFSQSLDSGYPYVPCTIFLWLVY